MGFDLFPYYVPHGISLEEDEYRIIKSFYSPITGNEGGTYRQMLLY